MGPRCVAVLLFLGVALATAEQPAAAQAATPKTVKGTASSLRPIRNTADKFTLEGLLVELLDADKNLFRDANNQVLPGTTGTTKGDEKFTLTIPPAAGRTLYLKFSGEDKREPGETRVPVEFQLSSAASHDIGAVVPLMSDAYPPAACCPAVPVPCSPIVLTSYSKPRGLFHRR